MTRLTEGDLGFQFPDGWHADQLDEWRFYKNHYLKLSTGIKCVDFLAIDPERQVWLVEVKDYRRDRRTTSSDLLDSIVDKVLGSLGLLMAACLQTDHIRQDQRKLARLVARQRRLRVVLHLEQPRHRSRLHPEPMNPASLRQALRRRLQVTGVVHEVRVVSRERGYVPWQVI